MNPETDRRNRHGAGPLQTDRYSEEFIASQNRDHDIKNGWSEQHRNIYTNPARRPESVFVPADQVWKERA